METIETIEGNKLLAGFMGVLTQKDGNFLTTSKHFGSKRVVYHSDWNWLMSVVEKIQSLGVKFVIGCPERVKIYNARYDGFVNGQTSDSLISCVWYGAVAFIKWHNEQKKQSLAQEKSTR